MSSYSERSVPFRWPAAWNEPRLLEIVKSGPINCVVDAPSAIASAAAASGLTAMSREELAAEAHFVADPKWPGIRPAKKKDGADAGPTGAPWVDANGWAIQLARVMVPGKSLVVEAVPDKGTVTNDSAYLLAIAEAATYGARWMVSLDDSFAKGLAANDNAMAARWRKMMDAIRFFDGRRPKGAWELRANVSVLSDFTGPNGFLGHEFLNLADRSNLMYRIVTKQRFRGSQDLPLPAILYLDRQAPDRAMADALKQAVGNGALLIASKQSGIGAWGGNPAASPIPAYSIRSMGRGRIAVPAENWADPFLLARDVRMLMGRRTDVLRFYNTGPMNVLYLRSRAGDAGAIHLLNYTRGWGGRQAAIATPDGYTTAEIVSLERPDGEPATVTARERRFSEVPVRRFSVYAVVELSQSKQG